MGLLHSSILNATPDVKVVAACEKSNLVRRFGSHAFKDIKIVEQVNQLAVKTYGQEVMMPPSGMADDDFPPPPQPEAAEAPMATPFSDEDIPF